MKAIVRSTFTAAGVMVPEGTRVAVVALATGGEAHSLIRLPGGGSVRVPNEALLELL